MRHPMNVELYARYCAPTTLAALLGCTAVEAAKYLTDAGANVGDGATANWGEILTELGGKLADSYPYYRGAPTSRPTVAQWLRGEKRLSGNAPRRYTYVVWTTTHTLLVRDGEVVADTMASKSQRARVVRAYRFPW